MFAPSAANFSAIAFPIPRAAPVISAVFPSNNYDLIIYDLLIFLHLFTFLPLLVELAEGTIDDLGHLRLSVLLSHTVRDTPVYIRYFEALNTIVGDVGHKIYVVNIELALLLAFGIDLAEEFDFCVVKALANLLHHPDIAEELIILRWV